jgi:acylphosphatase
MAVRRHVHYSGTVQGVGFRYTVRQIARGLAVTGFVRNLSDGAVEVVVEGEGDQVARLLEEVAAAMGDYITQAGVTDEPATGEFGGFRVRF